MPPPTVLRRKGAAGSVHIGWSELQTGSSPEGNFRQQNGVALGFS